MPSLLDVQKAIDQLITRGEHPTNRAVRAITGGDTGAVGLLIKQAMALRSQANTPVATPPEPAPIPPHVQTLLDQAKATIDQLGLDAVAAANQSLQAEREQLKQEIAQANQDKDDALQENVRFRQEIDRLQQKVAEQAQNIGRLETALAAANQATHDLHRERDQARIDLLKTQDDQRNERARYEKVLQDQQQANHTQAIDLVRLDTENKALNKAEQQYLSEIQRLQQEIKAANQESMQLREQYSRADQAREDAEQALVRAGIERQASTDQTPPQRSSKGQSNAVSKVQPGTRRKKIE